ncbi:DUF6300 family protein [Streptomyces sp. NPDC020951]|uniref:DUF6300 family protein n=1 Tax=Streptomyces sp. NPDC020951 TaxID=3365104 RepID=UPI0037A6251C
MARGLGTEVWRELCPACDARRPAARAFIHWHRDVDGDFEGWETETMHAHGSGLVQQGPSPQA